MRFDDSLRTVLASDASSGFGAQATWRQLVDLLGRGRIAADAAAIERLRALRSQVSQPVRAASARSLAFGRPPVAVVALFAEDELAIAAPVLRTAELEPAAWLALLPGLTPTGRSVLRHRRDLPAEVVRALEAFGAVDFVLRHDGDAVAPAAAIETPPDLLELEPFTVVPTVPPQPVAAAPAAPRFDIPELVARIDAFTRTRAGNDVEPTVEPGSFRFSTDAAGVIRSVDGTAAGPLIGASLALAATQGLVSLDAVAMGAFRRRSRFADARLEIGGSSAAAGSWRLAGVPHFDPATGRFTGFDGVGRRPRVDESAAPGSGPVGADAMRQLVHELRTPANAIAGFAELIETELLGPVPAAYRERATAIRTQAGRLVGAIEDLDTAARIESHALDLRPAPLAVEPLLVRAVADLQPLAQLRRGRLTYDPAGPHVVTADDRQVERLVSRWLAALVALLDGGERIGVWVERADPAAVAIHVDRPQSLQDGDGGPQMGADALETGEGAPLLGTRFALRLAARLAAELGGSMVVDADRLTLRLPAAVDRDVGQAIN